MLAYIATHMTNIMKKSEVHLSPEFVSNYEKDL